MFLLLPARLGDARDLTTERDFTNLVTCETEFAERATRTTRERAAVTLASRVRVAGQLLQFQASRIALFFRLALVVDDRLQRCALRREFRCQTSALLFTFDQCQFSHGNLSF